MFVALCVSFKSPKYCHCLLQFAVLYLNKHLHASDIF